MADGFSQNSYEINAKLTRFEERFVVLFNELLGEFRWPIKNLPDEVKIGETITLKISTQASEEDEKYSRMRRLLEELIN